MKLMPNVELCIDCKKCERICPDNGIFVIEGISIKCMHCEKNPCLRVCPEDAIERIGDKVVLHKEKCVGCALCIEACPIGAIRIDKCDMVAVKCNGCYGREDELCKLACPTDALEYSEKTVEQKQEKIISKLKKIYNCI